jgi:hypothetical protein
MHGVLCHVCGLWAGWRTRGAVGRAGGRGKQSPKHTRALETAASMSSTTARRAGGARMFSSRRCRTWSSADGAEAVSRYKKPQTRWESRVRATHLGSRSRVPDGIGPCTALTPRSISISPKIGMPGLTGNSSARCWYRQIILSSHQHRRQSWYLLNNHRAFNKANHELSRGVRRRGQCSATPENLATAGAPWLPGSRLRGNEFRGMTTRATTVRPATTLAQAGSSQRSARSRTQFRNQGMSSRRRSRR